MRILAAAPSRAVELEPYRVDDSIMKKAGAHIKT
jgi:hypothetical protein